MHLLSSRESYLERILGQTRKQKNNIDSISSYSIRKYRDPHLRLSPTIFSIAPETNAQVVYVPPSSLPDVSYGRVLGLYDPFTNKIYIANDLSEDQKKFVYYHEVAHSLGIYDERQADAYAESRLGYNPLERLAA